MSPERGMVEIIGTILTTSKIFFMQRNIFSQRTESPYDSTNDSPTSTLLFNDMPTSVSERDVRMFSVDYFFSCGLLLKTKEQSLSICDLCEIDLDVLHLLILHRQMKPFVLCVAVGFVLKNFPRLQY